MSSRRLRLRGLLTFPLSYAFERRVLGQVDRVWVTSADEQARLQRLYRRKSEVLGSTVPLPNERAKTEPSSRTLVGVSTLNYGPTWRGLRRFIEAGRGQW